MDVQAFNTYLLRVRAALVWQYGQYMAIRLEACFSIVLYNMGEFFAEVWYLPEDNKIALVNGFNSTKVLEHYLDQIDLRELMK